MHKSTVRVVPDRPYGAASSYAQAGPSEQAGRAPTSYAHVVSNSCSAEQPCCPPPTVPPATFSSYTQANFPKRLYDSVEERNRLFYDNLIQPQLQINHHNSYMEVKAPGNEADASLASRGVAKQTSPSAGQLIGDLSVTPNLYDDIIRPGVPTPFAPDLNRSGQPLTTAAMDPTAIKGVTWTPHQPCEVAPRHDSWYWVPDINSRMYERRIIDGAQEQPYANFNRMQSFVNLLGINMPGKKDMYTRPLNGKTYCETVKTEGQPAFSVF